jgi:hypothetical protein
LASCAALGACFEPKFYGPVPEGLQTWVAGSQIREGGVVSDAAHPVSVSAHGDTTFLFGYRESLGELLLSPGPFAPDPGPICGERGRALPRAEWVYALEAGNEQLIALDNALDPPRVGPYVPSVCRDARGCTSTDRGGLLCRADGCSEPIDAPTPPAAAEWPRVCSSREDCARPLPECASGEYRFDAFGACEPVAPCEGDWPIGADYWVRENGTGDGSQARPFGSIDEAIAAHPGAIIGVAAGTYPLRDPGFAKVIGLCPRLTTIVLEGRTFHDASFRGVRIRPRDPPSPDERFGLLGGLDASIELEEVELLGDWPIGLELGRSTARVSRVAFSGFREAILASASTIAIDHFAAVGFRRAAYQDYYGSRTRITSAFLVPEHDVPFEIFAAIHLGEASRLTLRRTTIERYRSLGVVALYSSELDAEDLVIRGDREAYGANAMLLRCPGPRGHRLSRVAIDRFTDIGVRLEGAGEGEETPCPEARTASVAIFDLHTSEGLPLRDTARAAAGIRLTTAPQVQVERYESFRDPRGVTSGVTSGSSIRLVDVSIVEPTQDDGSRSGAIEINPYLGSFLGERISMRGVKGIGVSIRNGPGRVEDLLLEGASATIGLLLEDALDGEALVDGARWSISGVVTGIELNGGSLQVDQLRIGASGSGLFVPADSGATSQVRGFAIHAPTPTIIVPTGKRLAFEHGSFSGTLAEDTIRCALPSGYTLEAVTVGSF